MSSSRVDAIRHIGSARAYKRMTISQALEAALAAVRNALDQADLQWVRRFADVPAREAAERLAVRSRDNPDGQITAPEALLAAGPLRTSHLPGDTVVQLLVTVGDARAIGACDFGIRAWCWRVGIDFEAGSASLEAVVTAYEREPQPEARAAVLHALRRARALRLAA